MRTGRPVAKIALSAEGAGILEGYTQRRKTAQALALRAHRVGLCLGAEQQSGSVARTGDRTDGREVASALCRARPRRTARRAAAWGAAQNRRCQGRKRHRADIGKPTAGRHALEHPQHGPALWHLDVERRADLACLWAAAAPAGELQAVY